VEAEAPAASTEAFYHADIVQEEYPNLLLPDGAVRRFADLRAARTVVVVVIFQKLSGRERAIATRPLQTNITCFASAFWPVRSDAVSRGGRHGHDIREPGSGQPGSRLAAPCHPVRGFPGPLP